MAEEILSCRELKSTQVPSPELTGWLACPGDTLDHWDLYWFIVKNDLILSFPGERSLGLGAMSLAGFKVRAATEEVKDKCAIKAYHPDGRAHYFVAGSKDDAAQWIKTLGKAAGGLGSISLARSATINPRKAARTGTDPALGMGAGGSAAAGAGAGAGAAGEPAYHPDFAVITNDDAQDVGLPQSIKLVKLKLTHYLIQDPAKAAAQGGAAEGTAAATAAAAAAKKSALARILSEPSEYPKAEIKRIAERILNETNSDYLSQKSRWDLLSKASLFATLMRKNRKGSGNLATTPSKSSLTTAFAPSSPTPNTAANEAQNGTATPSPDRTPPPELAAAGSGSQEQNDAGAEAGEAQQPLKPPAPVTPRKEKKVAWGGGGGGADDEDLVHSKSADEVMENPSPLNVVSRRSRSTDAIQLSKNRRMSVAAIDSENRSKQLRKEAMEAAGEAEEPTLLFKEGWILWKGYVAPAREDGVVPAPQDKSLWFLLDDNFLRAYASDESTDCLLEIDLETCTLEPRESDLLSLSPNGGSGSAEGGEKKYALKEAILLEFASEEDRTEWTDVIRLSHDYFLKMQVNPTDFAGDADESRESALKKAESEEFNQEMERMVSTMQAPAEAPAAPVKPAATVEVKKDRAQLAQEALANKQTMLYQKAVIKDKEKGFTPPRSQLDKEKQKEYALNLGGEEQDKERPNSVVLSEENGLVIEYSVEGGKVDEYNVTGGTLDVLVSRLADENHPNTNYIDIFLLSYRHIVSASVFMNMLITRFNVIPPPDPTPEEQAYFDRWSGVIKVRTMGVVKKWIDNYWLDFHYDEEAEAALQEFLQVASNDSPVVSLVERLKKIIEQRKQEVQAALLLAAAPKPTKPVKFDFFTVDPREFAYQLTMADYEKFKIIHPSEFVVRLWEGNSPISKNLNDMIEFFNKMSYFAATTICVQPNLKKRARIVENLIRALKECRRIRNFNGTMALLSGLSNASVRRLKKTWAAISPKHLEELKEIEDTMSAAFNYRTYREIFGEMEKQPRPGPCIPFIGLFLRDLTFLNDGNPKKFKSGLYNFAKLRMVSERVLRMQVYQQAPYSFPPSSQSEILKEYLRDPSVMTDENALYKCSLLCEPKEGEGEGRMIEKWANDAEKDNIKKAASRGRRQSLAG